MIYAAVVFSGLGGLLIELVLVRRFGLLLGNTSEASALVIGSYLLGLGLGGLTVAGLVRRGLPPLPTAAALYASVAAVSLALDFGLRHTPPLPLATGLGLLLITPGIPTALMGMAFPLVFAALGRNASGWRVGALIAANLSGSLVATAVGSNLLIPEIGASATAALASAAYAAAAALLFVASRGGAMEGESRAPAGALPALGQLAVLAAVSGMLVVGLQVLLLRRLPFYLEGFQPTLSGVLAACLLGLTLGSSFGTPLLARWFGPRAVTAALLLGVAAMNLGLHEWATGRLARLPITTDLAMHARIWLCAFVSAGPACFFLGAVLPLCVARFPDPAVRSALGGRLFFWQGLGSIFGSVLVTHGLTLLWPRGLFVMTPLVLGLITVACLVGPLRLRSAVGAALLLLVAALTGLSGAGTLATPNHPMQRSGFPQPKTLRYLDHHSDSIVTASAAYDRGAHSMALYTNEFRAAETGPLADYMQLLGTLPFLLQDDLEEVAVIAFGTGTTAKSVVLSPHPKRVHLVEISRSVIELSNHFAGDGPLAEPRTPAFFEDPRTVVHVTDGRRFLARRPAASLDMITMEPLLPYAPGTAYLYTREFYALGLAALRPGGLLMQWIPTHAVPPLHYRTLLATFARSFPHHSIWFLDGATLLVGSDAPHLPEPDVVERRIQAAGERAQIALHEARIATPADLVAAFVGDDLLSIVGDASDLTDDRPFIERVGIWKYNGDTARFYLANFAVLEQLARRNGSSPFHSPRWNAMRGHRVRGFTRLRDAQRGRRPRANARAAQTELAAARRILPESVILHHEETLALRIVSEQELTRRRGRASRDLLQRQLGRDSGSALFQAALGLPWTDPDLRIPTAEAAARAVAIQPLFFRYAPAFLELPDGEPPARSPLESIDTLPAGRALAEAASRPDPFGVAIRAAYRVRAARALIDVMAERPLTEDERRLLAPLLDPALLQLAADAIESRNRAPDEEISGLLRPDLPRPSQLEARASPD